MADSRDKPEPAADAAKPMQDQGRVTHDERGNAVWNWAKETGRFCVASATSLLKKLDFGDLKIEGHDEEQRTDKKGGRDAGGGYDPYNQPTAPRKPKPPLKK